MDCLKLTKWILSIGLACVLSACAGGDGDGNKTAGTPSGSDGAASTVTDADFQYNLQGQRCWTGTRKFRNLRELCEGLREDAPNRFCARSERYDYFRQHCPRFDWNPRDGRGGRGRR